MSLPDPYPNSENPTLEARLGALFGNQGQIDVLVQPPRTQGAAAGVLWIDRTTKQLKVSFNGVDTVLATLG